jgi:hypothetical protein
VFSAIFGSLLDWSYVLTSPVALAAFAFQVWMLIDAIRRREWIWVFFLIVFSAFAALWYFFMVYRSSMSVTRGFELPGAHSRRRIQELKAQIHHLDKAHHHSQLGDVYFQQGKLDLAESCYQAALERDPEDIDTRAHLGQTYLRKKQFAEARTLLEQVCAENPTHDYGHTMMAFAETLAAQNETDASIRVWQRILENHSYARARVQLAELHVAKNDIPAAMAELKEAIADDLHAPSFDRRRNRIWINRGKKLLRRLQA